MQTFFIDRLLRARQDGSEEARVDVSTRQDDRDIVTAHFLFFLKQRGECGCTTAFSRVMRIREQSPHR
jgi:hypothetical protein